MIAGRIETLARLLPPLDARLRAPEIESLAQVLPQSPDRAGWLERLRSVLRDVDREIAHWESSLTRVLAAGGGRQAVRAWILEYGGADAGDLRAVRRRLGVEVVRERVWRAVEGVGVKEELALKAIGKLLRPGQVAPPELGARLVASRRWQSRYAAAQALASHLEAGGVMGEGDEARFKTCLARPREHPWVLDAVDACWIAAHPADALDYLRDGLRPAPSPRHFLLRRLRVERLGRTLGGQGLPVLKEATRDPSPHVRIGLAAVAAGLQRSEAAGILADLADTPGEKAVRMAAVRAIGANLDVMARPQVRALLARRVQLEDHLPVLQGALEAWAALVSLDRSEARNALHCIDARVANGAVAAVSEVLARGRQAIVRLTDPERERLGRILARILEETPSGGHARVAWAELGLHKRLSDERVGRVLADLAATDVGLEASTDSRGLTVWRGDRRRWRLWRLFHEVSHPAPNKRQGHSHLLGRRVKGVLRAPPGTMAEVTETNVPGQRTLIEGHGSWGPALPMVDDVLDLGEGARVFSAPGVTTLTPPASRLRRWANRVRLAFDYAGLARLRSTSLSSDRASVQGRYVEALRERYGVSVEFHPDGALSRDMRSLVPDVRNRPGIGVGLAVPWLDAIGQHVQQLIAPSRTSQPTLAVFSAAVAAMILTESWWRRAAIRKARAAIPLSIGAWGTRGKSGTERIKAGLFFGLGYPVFVKTTGCEAMFIAGFPGLEPQEIFIHRPYDKSSIWEHARTLRQAAAMGTRVFLWECMALRPSFVAILQNDWMRDDLVTITNAFPDHEDLQGPTGHDVATTISTFVPEQSTLITSEIEFLPILAEQARARETTLHTVERADSEMLGSDLLALFPYREHPRNIALAARTAEVLGIDPNLAILTMAENVVPDLGALRVFPVVRVESRDLRFINGMSANERAACMDNWRRTGCDAIDVEEDPEQALVTVVNNRDDRVARSEVFSRIMAEDLSVDAHVLIGTNLSGLRTFAERAARRHVAAWRLRLSDEGDQLEPALERLAGWMARLRVPRPSVATFMHRLELSAGGAGFGTGGLDRVRPYVERWLGSAGALRPDQVNAELLGDTAMVTVLLDAIGVARDQPGEVATAATAQEVVRHALRSLCRMVVHARLVEALAAGELSDSAFRDAWVALFMRSLIVLGDPAVTGDRIVVAAARAVAPGRKVTVMGIQNIKGTGLDFAYRWVALGAVHRLLQGARSPVRAERLEALGKIEAFDDHGLMDAGLAAWVLLEAPEGEGEVERGVRLRVLERVRRVHEERKAALGAVVVQSTWVKVLQVVEGLVDWADGIVRALTAWWVMRELGAHRVSLSEASRLMHELYVRRKGGWLVRALGRGPGRRG